MSLRNIVRRFFGARLTHGELAEKLDNIASQPADTYRSDRLDWRQSIVDLLKLVGLNPSLKARKRLAAALGYEGALDGSAEMNIWLHGAVMEKLAQNNGVPPDSLKV